MYFLYFCIFLSFSAAFHVQKSKRVDFFGDFIVSFTNFLSPLKQYPESRNGNEKRCMRGHFYKRGRFCRLNGFHFPNTYVPPTKHLVIRQSKSTPTWSFLMHWNCKTFLAQFEMKTDLGQMVLAPIGEPDGDQQDCQSRKVWSYWNKLVPKAAIFIFSSVKMPLVLLSRAKSFTL